MHMPLWSAEKKNIPDFRAQWLNLYCLVFSPKAGLKILAGQRTLSGQSGLLTGQKLHSPVMLTGHVDSYS